eukprot:5681879-Amphidinium_carterae.1
MGSSILWANDCKTAGVMTSCPHPIGIHSMYTKHQGNLTRTVEITGSCNAMLQCAALHMLCIYCAQKPLVPSNSAMHSLCEACECKQFTMQPQHLGEQWTSYSLHMYDWHLKPSCHCLCRLEKTAPAETTRGGTPKTKLNTTQSTYALPFPGRFLHCPAPAKL